MPYTTKMWSVWLYIFPSEEVQMYLKILQCGETVLLTIKFSDAVKFYILSLLSFSTSKFWFPIVNLKIPLHWNLPAEYSYGPLELAECMF